MGLLIPIHRPVLIPLVITLMAAFAIPERGASAPQKKNAPAPRALQQNFPDADDLPPTPEELELKKRDAARAALVKKIRAAALKEVEAAAKSATSADIAVLAKSLGVNLDETPDPDLESAARSALRLLGDLDGDGTPEAVFRWSRVERFKAASVDTPGQIPGWVMFLLA